MDKITEYKSQKIELYYKPNPISNYTKLIDFRCCLHVIIPNSIKCIIKNMQKNNIYPNSIISVEKDMQRSKYNTCKIIKLLNVYECRYILNIINIHSLELNKFKKTRFLIDVIVLTLQRCHHINIFKITINKINNVNLIKCNNSYNNSKNIIMLRNVYFLNINRHYNFNECNLMLNNIHKLHIVCIENGNSNKKKKIKNNFIYI